MLPIFLELNALHLIGSVLSVILPFSFFPFGVYLAYIYYSTAIPPDLLDAARIDGCGEWQTFRHVALPLAKPVVALVFFFSFVADWNNFFLPYTVLADSNAVPDPGRPLGPACRRRRRSTRRPAAAASRSTSSGRSSRSQRCSRSSPSRSCSCSPSARWCAGLVGGAVKE